jgi:hypothetical protein
MAVAKVRLSLIILPHIFLASHVRSYELLFLKLRKNATAIPITEIGCQAMQMEYERVHKQQLPLQNTACRKATIFLTI